MLNNLSFSKLRLRAILGALLFLGISIVGCTREQDLTLCNSDIHSLLGSVEKYARDTGSVPDSKEGLQILVSKGYIRFVPNDP